MGAQDAALNKVLEKLDTISSRLDHIESKVETQGDMIKDMNAGVVRRAIKFGTQDINDACGVVTIGTNELIGETGPKKSGESEAKKEDRRKRQALGTKMFTFYLFVYAALTVVSGLDLLPVLSWETMKFDTAEVVSVWLRTHMWVPFALCFAYLVIIFGIQFYMKDRAEFDLRKPLAAWSAFLAIFSIAASIRTVPVLIKMLYEKGTHHVLCGDTRNDWVIDNPAGVWTMAFIFSKIPELIDTLFIVLRKRKLITLHWYHHVTVLLFCWHAWATFALTGIVFAAINASVHAIMYAYYAFTALGYRPTSYAIYITLIQIMQMVVGTAVTFYIGYDMAFVTPQPFRLDMKLNWDPLSKHQNTEPSCKGANSSNAIFGVTMYASYLYLFCLFFYMAYLRPKKDTSKKKTN
ncbi:Elongation of very long chain fatty acids protein 6 [Hondaea fermentalgiana]|uniref:Elongation of fatty acids protein n=1 Tax=Hondaea fermentalgiana TaxID=2315210 RepID=A0A2R5G2P4_9STRA|nr:Elongation of very long chain fatty acids protein 6 [Hondaea fermentalgiana]|eukprot:GBG25297.1 Elongation of very long chain fatty acids protein 6 [Hondaea fermentalgiana]